MSEENNSPIHKDWLKIHLPHDEAYLRAMLKEQERWDAKEEMIGPMKRLLEQITKEKENADNNDTGASDRKGQTESVQNENRNNPGGNSRENNAV